MFDFGFYERKKQTTSIKSMAIHFTKEEFSERKFKVVTELKKQNLDALLMFKQESMYWLTGYDSFGYVFFQSLILTSKGDFITFEPESSHSSYTKTGCLLLVFQRAKNEPLKK